MTGKKYAVGTRVMAYNHRGEREGKGTVVPSQDKRLLNYIKVELDRGFAAYYPEKQCKRLVSKT